MHCLVLFVLAAAVTASFAQLAAQPYVVPVYRHIAAQTPVKERFQHVCSGTIVDNSNVITTVTCIDMAELGTDTNVFIATAVDLSSANLLVKGYFKVTEVIRHPDYDQTTGANNIAILKFGGLFDYNALGGKVSEITWAPSTPAVADECVANFWSSADPFLQVNQAVKVAACPTAKEGTVCSNFDVGDATTCPEGSNGGSLVCNSKIAGLFSASRNSDCVGGVWRFEDLTQDGAWLWANIGNAAPIFNLSFAAILVLVVATLNNL